MFMSMMKPCKCSQLLTIIYIHSKCSKADICNRNHGDIDQTERLHLSKHSGEVTCY